MIHQLIKFLWEIDFFWKIGFWGINRSPNFSAQIWVSILNQYTYNVILVHLWYRCILLVRRQHLNKLPIQRAHDSAKFRYI
jgi:hypothetical protein